jgi:hypothetical protein
MEGHYLLGFGPRAARDLAVALYPSLDPARETFPTERTPSDASCPQ